MLLLPIGVLLFVCVSSLLLELTDFRHHTKNTTVAETAKNTAHNTATMVTTLLLCSSFWVIWTTGTRSTQKQFKTREWRDPKLCLWGL